MDDVEFLLAARRMKTWPTEWKETILRLPPAEARVIAELAVLLNARPCDGSEGTDQ